MATRRALRPRRPVRARAGDLRRRDAVLHACTIRHSSSRSPALLAPMPYPLALAVWQGVTLRFILLSVRSRACVGFHPSDVTLRSRSGWLLLALAFPAVFINLGHGHNGFLTAALFGGALATLERRPLVAGMLFGLLAYKPQFGMLIPLVLLATGRWRVYLRGRRHRRASGARRHARFRPRGLDRLLRLDGVHPHGRARTRRHRLVQDPERLFLGAHVARTACRSPMPCRARSRSPSRLARLALAQPRPLCAESRGAADRQLYWRRPTASITT